MAGAKVVFCGEEFPLLGDGPLTIGREADVEIDDNPYLHRVFLTLTKASELFWLNNVGTGISATVADRSGFAQTWLGPGAKIPLVMQSTVVLFSAGPTTYDFEVHLDEAPYGSPAVLELDSSGQTTVGHITLTPSQRLLILSLAEPILRRGISSKGEVPSSRAAAERLHWPMTTFNRKLDNVCEKLTKSGVNGLVAAAGKTASHRKVRLVEYAVATRLVTVDDLGMLDSPQA